MEDTKFKKVESFDEDAKITETYNIYTDGGYRRELEMGGWSYVIVKDKEILFEETKLVPEATNNIAELLGAVEGMKRFIKEIGPSESRRVNIICDSTYVISGIKMRWIEKWKKNGWKKIGTDIPVKNKDLWEKIDNLNSEIGNTKWIWVRGHNGNYYNERVDGNISKKLRELKEKEKING